MYLQEVPTLTGDYPDDNPYKGIMGFMIAGLKDSVPFVVEDGYS